LLTLVVGAEAATAGTITLSWVANPDTNVVGYKVFYGTTSQVYTTNIVAGNVTNLIVGGLTAGTTYYFAATSYDAAGDQSGYSAETSGTATDPTPTLTPVSAGVSGQFSFTVSGTAGARYVVQATTDLVNWTTLQTNTAPFTFVDTDAGRYGQRFYRATSAQ
jgi:hypothetical protein